MYHWELVNLRHCLFLQPQDAGNTNRGTILVIGSNQHTRQNPVFFNVTGYETITANFKGAILTETFIVLTSVVIGLVSTLEAGFTDRNLGYPSRKSNQYRLYYEMLSKNNKEECINSLEQIQRDLNFLHRKGKLRSQLNSWKENYWYISRVIHPNKV